MYYICIIPVNAGVKTHKEYNDNSNNTKGAINNNRSKRSYYSLGFAIQIDSTQPVNNQCCHMQKKTIYIFDIEQFKQWNLQAKFPPNQQEKYFRHAYIQRTSLLQRLFPTHTQKTFLYIITAFFFLTLSISDNILSILLLLQTFFSRLLFLLCGLCISYTFCMTLS